MSNIFEYATRSKLRFQSSRGALTVEQLWEVPLRSRAGDDFNLDAVAKAANRSLKAVSEESFVETERTSVHEQAEIALDVVKHVIGVKLAEEQAAERRAANKIRREKLLAALADKEAGKLSEMSIKELRRQIETLDADA